MFRQTKLAAFLFVSVRLLLKDSRHPDADFNLKNVKFDSSPDAVQYNMCWSIK